MGMVTRKMCTNDTWHLVPSQKWNGSHFLPYMKPTCTDQTDPCGYCNRNISYCTPEGASCMRTLDDGDYFPLREIQGGEYHHFKIAPMTHDSYCCKYQKHCMRNTLFLKIESCLGAVSMYVDIKKEPTAERYTWKSDHGATSGYVEQINFP